MSTDDPFAFQGPEPMPNGVEIVYQQRRITLRDYFAAACLQSILRHRDNRFLPADDAAWCYRVADAMLAERAK